jgi:hypothetical protein
MIEKTCRCGKTKKNFMMDIGPFFIDDCCLAAGYDELGKSKTILDDPKAPSMAELEAEAKALDKAAQAEAEAKEQAKREKRERENAKKREYNANRKAAESQKTEDKKD